MSVEWHWTGSSPICQIGPFQSCLETPPLPVLPCLLMSSGVHFRSPPFHNLHVTPGHTLCSFSINYYADDTQLYVPLNSGSKCFIRSVLPNCSQNLDIWKFSAIESFLIGSYHHYPPLAPALAILSIYSLVWALYQIMFVRSPAIGCHLWFSVIFWCTGDQGCTFLLYSFETVNKNPTVPLSSTFWNSH